MAQEEINQEDVKDKMLYPVLPLRDIVLFPHMVVPLFVGREKSVRALDSVMSENKQILLVAQKDANIDEPTADDLYKVGTLATVLQLLRLPDGTVKVLVEGGKRAKVDYIMSEEPFFEAYATLLPEQKEAIDDELNGLARSVMDQFERYSSLNRRLPPEVWVSVSQIQDYSKLADVIKKNNQIIDFIMEIGINQLSEKLVIILKRQT